MHDVIRVLRLLASAGAFGLACSLLAQDTPPEPEASFVDPDSAEAKSYRVAGSHAIDRLVMTLLTDCSAAVAGNKEVEALPTFHFKDVPLKNGTVAGMPRIKAVKLTSFKVRNPANAPDAAETLALTRFRMGIENGAPPPILVQQLKQAEGTEWRVYKGLANIRQCGTCHGSPDEMTPELREALQKKYPDDQGNGFRLGEWRGVIRVTVADPASPGAAATPPAKTSASTTKR